MAWTDYSSTESASWASTIGTSQLTSGLIVGTEEPPVGSVALGAYTTVKPNELVGSFNIPGFDSGYAPSVPSPIANNIDEGGGGGGGSTRPTSGFLYPRGQG